jgi:hypothetical protein
MAAHPESLLLSGQTDSGESCGGEKVKRGANFIRVKGLYS